MNIKIVGYFIFFFSPDFFFLILQVHCIVYTYGSSQFRCWNPTGVLGLNFEVMRYPAEKADSPTQLVPDILKHLLINELSVSV